MRIRFGPFAFDPQSRLLWRDDAEVALPPRVLGVLEVLIDRAGQVVPRQDLLEGVWKDAFVTDTSLAEAVSFLRQALGDDPQSPRYIQTVHRRGYRFLVTPTAEPPEHPAHPTHPAHPAHPAHPEHPEHPAPPAPDWQLVPWSAAALCAGLAIAAVWHTATQRVPEPPPTSRFELRATPGTTFDRGPQPIDISPDGRSLAWSACDVERDRCAIYTRPIDRLDARALDGTAGGHSPIFSPDGRWIAFFADGALKKIAAAGGAATTIASATDPAGAAWGADGRIVFAASAAGGLSVVDDQGGRAQPLTHPSEDHGELRHRFPAWVPDSRGASPGLLFVVASDPDAAASGTLATLGPDGGAVRTLRAGVQRATPASRGYLLLAAGTDLQAATFDERSLVLTGASDSVPAPAGDGPVDFSVGADALAVVRRAARAPHPWNDGADASPLARLTSLSIAADGRRAAGVDANGDIWIADLPSGAPTRLTFGGGAVSPAWAPAGDRLFFAARSGGGAFHVFSRQTTDRGDAATPLTGAPPQAFPTSGAADGRVALTIYKDERTAVAIAPPAGGAPRVLTDGPFDEAAAAFSPDGRWLALESTASGRVDVIVRGSADGRRVAAVSPDGGTSPAWSADGRAIYFQSGRRLMKASFTPDAAAPVGRPEVVYDHAGECIAAVAPGGRLLIERRTDTGTAVIALQWLRELRERLPLPVNAPR